MTISRADEIAPDPIRGPGIAIGGIRSMTGTHPALGRTAMAALALLLAAVAGCSALGDHNDRKIPQPGVIDPNQPRELQMVSQPPYVVEPPDEIEVSVRPTSLEFSTTTIIVRQDGVIDLGFHGDVYVAGLTLDECERKIAEHLAPYAAQKKLRDPLDVSVRLINGNQSKQYYVLGVVTTQGKFPITGGETVLDGLLQPVSAPTASPRRPTSSAPTPPAARARSSRSIGSGSRIGATPRRIISCSRGTGSSCRGASRLG